MRNSVLLFVLLSLSLCGCVLDKTPYDAVKSEDVLGTEKGMDLLLRGAYSELSSSSYYGASLYLYEASKGPDFFVRNINGGYSFQYENGYSESSSTNGNAKNLWSKMYSVIRNTTILLENIDSVQGDSEELERIKGEAYALRGLSYFDLCRVFAYPPKFSCTWGSSYSETFKWGVPIIKDVKTGTDIFDYEITRESADKSWAYIVEQLSKACGLLEGKVTEPGHVNEAAAKALLLRAYLYMEDNEKVVELGQDWLSRFESSYSLLSYESYPSTYYKVGNSESIWELKYTESDNLGSYSLNYWVRRPTYNIPGSEKDGQVSDNIGYAKLGLTYGGTLCGMEALKTYSMDVRQTLICSLGLEGYDYHTARKYVGDPYHFVHNIPIVRLPEVYLSLSEAYYKLGDTELATEYLSKITLIRRKAGASIGSINQILNERRKELILEGQTYWDWFRNGRNISGRPIMECITSNSTISFGSISGRNYRTVYPIPLAEMNANPAIRDQQNPGYAPWEFGIEDE